ncbi:MAG TPA: ATP-binding cassette domain-containing protein [Ferruginibacter sp.]|nr:ATP-binding cassette domain-containing protein [Ferruginibacter sp.]
MLTNITLDTIAPVFLEEEKMEGSGIWNNHVTFNRGENIQLVAPSGSGKTSLIHFLYGERKDYNGSIFFDNKELKRITPEQLSITRSVNNSIIFQDLRLFHDHTVLQNIDIKRSLHPYHSGSKIAEMASRLGIHSKLNKLVKTCSYGEQQRVAIIRSLQQPFDFLLMDEPFSHLDEDNRIKAMELIQEEATIRNAGIIFADLNIIPYFNATRVIQL